MHRRLYNNGKIDIAEMAKYFEKIFDIEWEKSIEYTMIKNRKIKTKFLDILKENLIKRFDEQENK
jgi:hypothetical protein